MNGITGPCERCIEVGITPRPGAHVLQGPFGPYVTCHEHYQEDSMTQDIVRPGAVITAAQVDHIKAHQDLFEQHVGPDRTVEEYLNEYIGEKPDIYERLCSDLGLAPLPTPALATQQPATQPVTPDLSALVQGLVSDALQTALGQPEDFHDALSKVDPRDSEAALAMLDFLMKTQRLARVGILDGGQGYLFMYQEPKGTTKAGYRPGATQGDRIVDEAVEAQRATGAAPVKRGMCPFCISLVKDVDGTITLDDDNQPNGEQCAGAPDGRHQLK